MALEMCPAGDANGGDWSGGRHGAEQQGRGPEARFLFVLEYQALLRQVPYKIFKPDPPVLLRPVTGGLVPACPTRTLTSAQKHRIQCALKARCMALIGHLRSCMHACGLCAAWTCGLGVLS